MYPQVYERCVPNSTHPNRRPKGDGNCTIGVIFIINRYFNNKYSSENQKILTNKMSFISNFTYAVQLSLGSVIK